MEASNRLGPDEKVDTREFTDIMEDINRLSAKINLLLNPTENDHMQIASLLHDVVSLFPEDGKSFPKREIGKLVNRILAVTQEVVKREWERVKRFE